MIIWLASYPRSGNTLLRLILAQAFGLQSASEYEEDRLPPGSSASELTTAGAAAQIGVAYHAPRDETWSDFYAEARATRDTVLIKTHGPPCDDMRAIYVVRDGRAAVVSHLHFMRNYGGARGLSIADVVRGVGGFGSWSAHLSAWSPLDRPGTLLLRFGTLVHHPRLAIDALAHFLGRSPLAGWQNPFARLRLLVPNFFRAGCDAWNIAEMTSADLALFWEHHGAWMDRLSYARPAT